MKTVLESHPLLAKAIAVGDYIRNGQVHPKPKNFLSPEAQGVLADLKALSERKRRGR